MVVDGQNIEGPRAYVAHESHADIEHWEPPAPGAVWWRTLLSGDRTPSDSMTVGVAEIVPGEPDRVRLHRHEPPETYYFLSGAGAVVIDDGEQPVRAGSVAYIPSNTWHTVRNTGTEALRLLYVFPVDAFTEVEYHFADEDS